MTPSRFSSIILATLLGMISSLTTGCGGGDLARPSVRPTAIPSVETNSRPPDRRPAGEAVIATSGQAVDTDEAVDIVKAEYNGGEADAKDGPTPRRFLEQEADLAAIVDEPYEPVIPTGLERAAAAPPAWNPMTVGRVELGKQLYYDPRLSLDSTVSCASCHDPAKGWTDQRRTSMGIGRIVGARNSPTVLNTTLGRSFFWDGRTPFLETQVHGPIQNKIEMGDQSYRQIIERLRAIPGYQAQFRRIFGTEVTLDGLSKAIACFERTALSGDSAYDLYNEATKTGDPADPATFAGLTLEQKRGMVLFGIDLRPGDPASSQIDPKFKARANCTACHSGDNFSDELFHNTGVGYDAATSRFADLGRYIVTPIGTKSPADRGAFKTPTIRDITRTAPYMHDGSEATLEAVIDFYDRGGNRNPEVDAKIAPLNLATGEKADLIAFMKALTGKLVPVEVPQLPPGRDGRSPDPRAALNAPGGALSTSTSRDPARSAAAPKTVGMR